MKTKYIGICSIIFLAFTGLLCAQTKTGIFRATAYQQEISGGNIPVDVGGQPMHKASDTSFYLVIETTAFQLPKLEKAYRNGMAYTLTLTDSTKNDQAELMIAHGQMTKASKGNKLWRYELTNIGQENMPSKMIGNAMLLEGRYNGRKIDISIKNIITLEPELRP